MVTSWQLRHDDDDEDDGADGDKKGEDSGS